MKKTVFLIMGQFTIGMKIIFVCVILCFVIPLAKAQDAEFETATEAVKNMKLGWNLWNTLDAAPDPEKDVWFNPTGWWSWETAWENPLTKPELLKMMRKAGFNAIRVPVTWYPHMDANEQVDPEWMKRVHEVVDYVIDQGMYCILNTHHDNGAWIVADPENYEQYHERFEKLWQQIAEEFKDYDEHLVFEAYNEVLDKYQSWFLPSEEDGTMHVEQAYNALNAYAQSFVNVVRSTGGNNIERNLVINTYSGCVGPWTMHAESFEKMNIPKDVTKDHIIFGIHCYWLIINEDVDGILNNIRQHITSRGIPTIISEWGYDKITDLEQYFLTETKNAGISTFLWGGMSSGLMRSFPAFDNSEDTKNFFKAYYGENYEPTLLTTGDYDKLKVTFKEYDAELGLFDGNNSPYSLDECTGLKVVLKDTPEKGKLQFNAWGENGLQTLEIQSKSATIIFDRSQIGEKLPLVTLQSKSQGSYVVEVDSIIAILNGEPYRKESIGWSHHDCDVVHLRKQFVHTVEYDGLYSELNIFSDDIPLQLKNYKGIRLELAEPLNDAFHIHIKVYGDGYQKEDYIGLTGVSTTIMFNTDYFSNEINRVTLQTGFDGKSEAKVVGAWLIRQDGTEEYSDLSPFWGCKLIDNIIGAEEVTAFVGSKVTLPIMMNNTENIIGMQFDLTLPEGVSVVTDEDDEYMFTLTDRAASSHRVTADKMSDGNYRVLVSSLQNSKFIGNEGSIIEATLAIANDMAAGEYPVEITNVEMTTAQNVPLRPDAFVSKLIVQDVVAGDANGDGTVSVTDVTMTISYILGQTPAGFNKDAVDINGDGSITVTDVTLIIGIILQQN